MKIHRHVFDRPISLVNLGDVHRGDNACDVETFRKNVAHIADNDDVFWVSTGDLLNCGTKDSKTGPYGTMIIDDELSIIGRELRPIMDKCLGIVESNHHARVKRSVGMNLDKLIAREFEIPYLGDIGMINIVCGRLSYFCAMHHGFGGGRTIGAKANGIVRLEEVVPGCDLYMEGHTHTHMVIRDILNTIDRKRIKITPIDAVFSVTGHYIKYFDSYATSMKLKPKPIGSAIHHFRACDSGKQENKKIRVDFLS